MISRCYQKCMKVHSLLKNTAGHFKTLSLGQSPIPKEENMYNIQGIPIWNHTRLSPLELEVCCKTWILTITAKQMTCLFLS